MVRKLHKVSDKPASTLGFSTPGTISKELHPNPISPSATGPGRRRTGTTLVDSPDDQGLAAAHVVDGGYSGKGDVVGIGAFGKTLNNE